MMSWRTNAKASAPSRWQRYERATVSRRNTGAVVPSIKRHEPSIFCARRRHKRAHTNSIHGGFTLKPSQVWKRKEPVVPGGKRIARQNRIILSHCERNGKRNGKRMTTTPQLCSYSALSKAVLCVCVIT